MKAALVLRPEPDNSVTAARLQRLSFPVHACPLFAVAPVAWTPPDPAHHDAVLLTSANAVRHAGPALATLAGLPVLAVGERTAASARAAGFRVALVGSTDVAALLARARQAGWISPLHLAGRDRHPAPGVASVTVYRSDTVAVADAKVLGWRDHVALLHSARAAQRFAALVDAAGLPRNALAITALSATVMTAAGPGWRAAATAPRPTDPALVAAATALIDRFGVATDKPWA